ncbi:MAG: adenosylmethionine decarboxylase [Chloroflexota bacterium]|nr:adenosylmethionine decarboxylase [Chloroflexota bacterium]
MSTHLLVELRDCEPGLLSDLEFLRSTLITAAREVGATVIGDTFYPFPPYGGVSGVVIIAESHLSIHTWPEHSYAAVDIFTCGNSLDPQRAVEIMVRELQARDHSVIELERGNLHSPAGHRHERG